MDADAGSSGDLEQDGQQAFETRGLRDGDAIDERRDEVVAVLEGRADGDEVLDVFAAPSGIGMFYAVEVSVYCLRAVTRRSGQRFLADEFIVCHLYFFFL